MNKISDNSKILKGYARINLLDIEPVQFKETFISCFVFDSVMNETDLDTMVRRFFRLSILLSNTDHISNEQRSKIIQMLEGFYFLDKIILV